MTAFLKQPKGYPRSKKTKGLPVSILLAFAPLFPTAHAFDIYSIDFKARIKSGSISSPTKRVGTLRGELRIRSDQEAAILKIGRRTYDIEVKHLYVGRVSNRPQIRFEIPGEDLAQILEKEFNSGWKNRRKQEALDLLTELKNQGQFPELVTIRFASLPRLDFDQPDRTLVDLVFEDDQNSSSPFLRMEFDFDDRATRD